MLVLYDFAVIFSFNNEEQQEQKDMHKEYTR